MSDEKPIALTVFDGVKDKTSAFRLQQKVNDPLSFRTAITDLPDRTILYRTKGGMPQWRIEMKQRVAHRGFVARPTWFYPNADGYAYLSLGPYLLFYTTQWRIRNKHYDYGSATGYSVVSTPSRIPSTNVLPDVHFFDVMTLAGGELRVFMSAGKTAKTSVLSSEFPLTSGIPIVFPSSGADGLYPAAAGDDATDFHVFVMNSTGISHVDGRTMLTDAAVDVMTQIDGRLPVGSGRLGASYAYDPLTKTVTFFGVNATFTGPNSDYLNLYHWYAVVSLTSADPHLAITTIVDDPVTERLYTKYIDLNENESLTSEEFDTPGEYKSGLPMTGDCYDVWLTNKSIIAQTGTQWTVELTESLVDTLSGQGVIGGTHDIVTYTASVTPYNEVIPVGTPVGVGALHHTASINVNYTRTGSYVNSSLQVPSAGYTRTPEQTCTWWLSDGGSTTTPGETVPGTGGGGSVVVRYENQSTSNADYHVVAGGESIPLFSMTGALNYTDYHYEMTRISHIDASKGRAYHATQTSTVTYYSEPDLSVASYYIRNLALSAYGTAYWFPVESGESYVASSSVDIEVRDYIYHDIRNSVAIYVEAVGQGTNTVATDGKSTWTITLEVLARGVLHSFPLYASVGSGHNIAYKEHEAVYGNVFQPTYLPPPSNPAVYFPVCEQGAFDYIAYTTAEEEAAGVARRFILSLPLSISRRNVTIGEDPVPPTTSYDFKAYNMTEAQSCVRGGIFAGLLGKVFHIHVSQAGTGDWLAELNVVGDSEHHFSECYRT